MRTIAIALVLSLGLVGAAGAEEDPSDVICKALLDRASRVARSGDIDELRRMRPGIEKCKQIAEAKLARQAQEIVDRHNQTAAPAAQAK